MDWMMLREKLIRLWKEYFYIVILLAAGILMMLQPGEKKQNMTAAQSITAEQEDIRLDKQLEDLLSVIQGAGKVKVLLTLEQGECCLYQFDEESRTGESQNRHTVILTDGEKNQRGLIQQIMPPQYRGAVILCQGADQASVRLAIVEAVANATGLSSDKISVLKMK